METQAKRQSTGREIATKIGVNVRTVQNWAKDGCPHTATPQGNAYNAAEVKAWMDAHHRTGEPGRPPECASPDLEAARLRKENALASKYELAVERERGTLRLLADVKAEWSRRIQTAKSRLLGLPAAVSPSLEGLTVGQIEAELRKRLVEALSPLDGGE